MIFIVKGIIDLFLVEFKRAVRPHVLFLFSTSALATTSGDASGREPPVNAGASTTVTPACFPVVPELVTCRLTRSWQCVRLGIYCVSSVQVIFARHTDSRKQVRSLSVVKWEASSKKCYRLSVQEVSLLSSSVTSRKADSGFSLVANNNNNDSSGYFIPL